MSVKSKNKRVEGAFMKPGRTSAPIVCLIVLSVLSRLLYGSQIVQHQLDSQMLAGNLIGENPLQTFIVYLPDGYDEGDERYPVVYWIPGGNLSQMSGISAGSIDEAIRSGQVPATIIVFMPKKMERFGSTIYLSSDAFGHWEEFFISEVIPFIDDTYRTHANPQTRGIMGFSSGGFPALMLPVLHPDTWGAVGLNDPSSWIIPVAVRDWPDWVRDGKGFPGSNTDVAFRTMPTSLEGYATASLIAIRHRIFGQVGARFSPNPDSPVFADFPRDRQGRWVPDAREKWREFDITDPNIFTKHLDALQDLSMLSIILREDGCGFCGPSFSREFIETLQAAGINAKLIDGWGGHNDFQTEKFITLLEDVSSALTLSLKLMVDFNGDGIVDCADICMMVEHWHTDEPFYDIAPPPFGDGIVDVQDLALLAEHLFEEVLPKELIAYWKLDETEGIVAHDSAWRNDANLIGDPTWQPDAGKVGGALALDGIDDYVSTPFVLNPSYGSFSVLAWVRGGVPGQTVVSQVDGADWLGTYPSDGALMTALTGSGRFYGPLLSQTVITDGNWHRIGLVWDGLNRTLYVDDVPVAQDTQTGLVGSGGGLNIGCGTSFETNSFWFGLIDDVRIYNRAVEP